MLRWYHFKVLPRVEYTRHVIQSVWQSQNTTTLMTGCCNMRFQHTQIDYINYNISSVRHNIVWCSNPTWKKVTKGFWFFKNESWMISYFFHSSWPVLTWTYNHTLWDHYFGAYYICSSARPGRVTHFFGQSKWKKITADIGNTTTPIYNHNSNRNDGNEQI